MKRRRRIEGDVAGGVLSVSTIAFHGYSLEKAVETISDLGVGYVELAFMTNYFKEITEESFTAENAASVRRLLSDHGVSAHALSGHLDMGLNGSAARFKRRMEFAREVGAKIVNTSATSISNGERFNRNMEEILPFAESMGLVICLENPGDGEGSLLGCAEDGSRLIRSFGSPSVRLNYDFANTFLYSKGAAVPEEDCKRALPYIGHCHVKDVGFQHNVWRPVEIGTGIVNYRSIFQSLLESRSETPLSVELPFRFYWRADFRFISDVTTQPLPLETISERIDRSVRFINAFYPAHRR